MRFDESRHLGVNILLFPGSCGIELGLKTGGFTALCGLIDRFKGFLPMQLDDLVRSGVLKTTPMPRGFFYVVNDR